MPAAPRQKTKATKIAFKVLGVPANLRFVRNKTDQKVNRRLNYEESSRVK